MSPLPSIVSGDPAPPPRRSSLVVPGTSARMIEKAARAGADEVVLDLEDSVPLDEKIRARATVCQSLQDVDFGPSCVTVRVNQVTAPECLRDVIALVANAGVRLDCLMVPKVEGGAGLHYLDHLLRALEAESARPRPLRLVTQIESAAGMTQLTAALAATDRVAAVAFGPGDYAADMGSPLLAIGATDPSYPGHQWHWAMSEVVNHARAHGAQAIDGPYADVHDEAGFRRSAALAVTLGYDGKHCIHPRQVPWAREAFTPAPERVAEARRILDAVAEAAREGRGAASLDGRMIDEASRRIALRLLARAG